MKELNEKEMKMLERALFNQRLHTIERIKEMEEQTEDYILRRISQECDDIKIINDILQKLNLTKENKKG